MNRAVLCYYSFQFQVGGPKTGYRCTVEVKAKSKRAANMRIRARIRAMPDVKTPPEFTIHDIVKGLAVLESEGHTRVRLAKFTRPQPLEEVQHPKLREPKTRK